MVSAAGADTLVPAGDLGTQTWSASKSPYRVSGDVTIAPGSTLLMLPGTRVLFAPGDSLASGRDPTRTELIVGGALRIEGSALAPVVLEPSGAHVWGGLTLLGGSRGSWIRGAEVRRANIGLTYETAEQNLIEMTTFDACEGAGIVVTAGVPVLDAVTVSDGGAGIEVIAGGSANLRNVLAVGNRSHGLRVRNGVSFPTTVNVFNATLHLNGGDGVRAESGTSAATVNVKNTLITSSGGAGLVRQSKTTLSIEFSDVWDNGLPDDGVIDRGLGVQALDPLYAGAPSSLMLEYGSPSIGAGTSTVALTRDRRGTPRPLDGAIDLGAFEFVLTPFCGDAVVASGEVCDDGVWNGRPGHCDASCTGAAFECGDGTRDPGEACDDGNRDDGDGCDAFCGISGIGFEGTAGTSAAGGASGAGATSAADAGSVGTGGNGGSGAVSSVGGSAGVVAGGVGGAQVGSGGTGPGGSGSPGGTGATTPADSGRDPARRGRPTSDGGCGCRAGRATSTLPSALALVVAFTRAARRRRRAAGRTPP